MCTPQCDSRQIEDPTVLVTPMSRAPRGLQYLNNKDVPEVRSIIPQGHESISCLSTLRHEDADIISEDWSLAIEEIGSQLQDDGQLRELLEDLTTRDGAVIAGSTGHHDESATALDVLEVLLDSSQHNLSRRQNATSHGVDNGIRLLVDFLNAD